MSPIAGWYDDPRDDSSLRYWDGDAWTDHVTPKQAAQGTRGPEAAPAGPAGPAGPASPASPAGPGAAATPPPAPQWVYPGGPPAQQQTWNYGTPPQQVWPPAAAAPPGQLAPYGVVTPDGVAITSWGKRLAARLLDMLFVAIGGLPFTGYFVYHFYQALSDQLEDPSRSPFNPTNAVIQWEIALAAMSIVIGALYETFCLRQWGATVGKRKRDQLHIIFVPLTIADLLDRAHPL